MTIRMKITPYIHLLYAQFQCAGAPPFFSLDIKILLFDIRIKSVRMRNFNTVKLFFLGASLFFNIITCNKSFGNTIILKQYS